MALVGPSSWDRVQLRHPWHCEPVEPVEKLSQSTWPDKEKSGQLVQVGAVLAGLAATAATKASKATKSAKGLPGRSRSFSKGLAAKLSKELKELKVTEQLSPLADSEDIKSSKDNQSIDNGSSNSSKNSESSLKTAWQWLRSKAHDGAGQARKVRRTVRQHASVLFSKAQQKSKHVKPVKRIQSAWQRLGESWSRFRPRQQFLSVALALVLLVALWPLRPRHATNATSIPEQRTLQLSPEEEARLQMLNEAESGVVYVKGKPTLWISEKEEQGAFVPGGTAWIFDSRHVITSLSNIDQARRGSLKVILSDRTELPARVLGVDAGSDLAVLELPAKIALRDALPLGSSASLRLGQDVILIGREATLDMRISKGVVYGLGQPLALSNSVEGRPVQSCIQTDVLMNPTNRGGALLNSRGQVVGMAVGKSEDGVGQAIPADSLRKHIESIISTGHVTRPSLGMYLAPDGFAEKLGVSGGGIVVQEVVPGSAAKKAGLRPGDIIIAQGDHPIHRMDDLITVLEPFTPGDHFSLSILRQTAGEGTFAPFSPQAYSQLDLTIQAVASD